MQRSIGLSAVLDCPGILILLIGNEMSDFGLWRISEIYLSRKTRIPLKHKKAGIFALFDE